MSKNTILVIQNLLKNMFQSGLEVDQYLFSWIICNRFVIHL